MGGKGKGKGKAKGTGKGTGKAQAKAKAEPAPAKVPTSAADLPVGTELTAQFVDGAWYKAKILKVRKNEPRVRVNYHGYDEYYDAWLGPDQLRSKLIKGPQAAANAEAKETPKATGTKLLEVGAACQVQLPDGGKSCEGTVLSISTAKARTKAPVKVQVELWLPKSAVQVTRAPKVEPEPAPKAKGKAKAKAGEAMASEAPATGLTVGTTLTALYDDGEYYQATVTKLKATGAKPIRIHYLGHDESSDRWVGLDSVRSKALPKATAKPKGKAKAGKNGSEGKEAKVGRWKDEEDDPWEFVPPAVVKEGKGGGGKGRSKGKGKGKGR